MSSILDELRRRAREQEMMEQKETSGAGSGSPPSGHESAGDQPEIGLPTKALSIEGQVGSQLAEAVAQIFEQTRAFKPRFAELSEAIDLVERLGESTARTFAPLKAFQAQLLYLAASFEPVLVFQETLERLVRTFPPVKALRDELTHLTESFQRELELLIDTLEPARDFRERIMTLARSLEQANELLNDLRELRTTFIKPSPPAAPSRDDPASGDDLVAAIVTGSVESGGHESR